MGPLSLGRLSAWSRGHRPLSVWAQMLSGPISSFPAGRGPGERHGESDSEETREDTSIQDAGPVPGTIPDPALSNRFRNGGTRTRRMQRSQARITSPPLVPLLTPKKQGLDATSLHLNVWTKPQRPPCTFPNLTAPLQQSQRFSPFPRLDPPRTMPHTGEGAAQAEVMLCSAPLPAEPLVPPESCAGSKEEPELAQQPRKRSAGLVPPGLRAGSAHQY